MAIYLYRKYQQRKLQQQLQAPEKEDVDNPITDLPTTKKCPHQTPLTQKCQQCTAQKSATRKYRWKVLFCLLPGFFLASLDLTIVATALPFIASHFDKFNQLNWIVTAFTLTSTAFIPFFGQLSDIFGRHSSIQAAVLILTIGSILCATAPVWPVLLLGRALQGMGCAGVSNIAMIILADSVSLKEQAINTSIFQLMNGVGYSVGPVIGGYIVDSNWRYAFVLCAGLGAVSMICIFFLRKELKPGTISLSHPPSNQTRLTALLSGLATLDLGGIVLFISAIALIILGTSWGGSTYAWSSAAVIAPLVIGCVLLIGFVAWERLFEPSSLLSRKLPRTSPLIPFDILRQKDVALVCIIAAATGAALYSVFYFIGIYFTLVEAYAASKAGIQLLYYIPGLGVGVYLAIFLCNVLPRQTFWPLSLGTVVETAGIAVLTYAVKSRNRTLVNVMMGIAGAGTGVRFMPSNLHLSGMFGGGENNRLASVYSLLRFAMPFGGTLALTIMGSVFQNEMSQWFGSPDVQGKLGANNGTGFSLHNQAALQAINKLPQAQQEAVRRQGADATMWAFISILPILGLSMFVSVGLGNVWISKRDTNVASTEVEEGGQQPQEEVSGAAGGEILTGVYLLALLRGTVKGEKKPAARRAAWSRRSPSPARGATAEDVQQPKTAHVRP